MRCPRKKNLGFQNIGTFAIPVSNGQNDTFGIALAKDKLLCAKNTQITGAYQRDISYGIMLEITEDEYMVGKIMNK